MRRAQHADSPAYPWVVAWYSALIDRQNGHLDSAIETLETLVETRFEEARRRGLDFSYDLDVLTELGRSLYERARQLRGPAQAGERQALLERARRRFDQVLAIDPEYASAHYNLALVYEQQDDHEHAAAHRALHQQYRTDDAAIEQAVTLHRSRNPAADHATSELAIYSLQRPDNGYAEPGKVALACHGDPT